RNVRDAARLHQLIAGRDEMDSTSAAADVPDYVAALDGGIRGTKIGLPREYFEGLTRETADRVDAAIEVLKKLGCEVHDVSLPHTAYAIPAYYIIATAE